MPAPNHLECRPCDPYSIGHKMIKNNDHNIAMRGKRKEQGRERKKRDTTRKEFIVMLPLDLCTPPLSPFPSVSTMPFSASLLWSWASLILCLMWASNCTLSIAIFFALFAQKSWQGHARSTQEIYTFPIPECVVLSHPVSVLSFPLSFACPVFACLAPRNVLPCLSLCLFSIALLPLPLATPFPPRTER